MDISTAVELVRAKWDASGECRSCGWHGALYEYGPLEAAITINEADKRLELRCLSGEPGHRGVRIYYED